MAKSTKPRWKREHDAKLRALYRKKNHSGNKPLIDTRDLSCKTIKAINDQHFPEFDYANFGPLYRKKARAWNLEQELAGSRRQETTSTASSTSVDDEEEQEDEEDFAADQDIDNEELDGLLSNAKKDPLETIQSSLSSLSINKKSAKMAARKEAATSADFSMDFRYPYLMYQYIAEGQEWVSVDFLVPTQSEKNFRVAVRNNGTLSVGTIVPKFFTEDGRMQAAHEADDKFNINTHKATAQSTLCDKIQKNFENDLSDDIMGTPQLVKLPIPVEDEVAKWECQLFASDEHAFAEELQTDIYYSVLSVDLKGKEKKKKKVKGKVRIIGSPARATDTTATGGAGDAAMEDE